MGSGASKKKDKFGADFNTWLYERLTIYFGDIERYICDYKIPEKEVYEIQEAVEDCISMIVREVEFINKKFSAKDNEIKKVGSFFEKTDVINLDKITFYVVMRALSRPDFVVAYNQSEDKTNELHKVYFKGDKIDQTWVKISTMESSARLRLRSVSGLLVQYNDLVVQVIIKLREQTRDTWGRLKLTAGYAPLIEDAAVKLKCTWDSKLEIRLSLVPVIEIYDLQPYVTMEKVASKRIFSAVMSKGSVLLVPAARTDDSFSLSFAPAEVDIMKHVITYSHRRAYKILKFIIKGYNESIPEELQIFRNKSIKTLVIHHDVHCRNCDQLADCIMAVLSDMLTLLKKQGTNPLLFIPSIYDKNVNTLSDTSAKPAKQSLDLNKECLEDIIDHFTKEVGSLQHYEFNKTVKGLVPLYAQLLRDHYQPHRSSLDNETSPKFLAIH